MQVPVQLVNQVLALPPDARAELIILLRDSLPIQAAPGEACSDEQLAVEWTAELERRIAASRIGDTRGVDAQAAFDLVRKQLATGQGASGA